MLDKLLGGSAGTTGADAAASQAASSAKLLSALTSRLTTVEASQRLLRDELVAKDREILRLRQALAAATLAATPHGDDAECSSSRANATSDDDRAELEALRSELLEMKQFLADYGLEWVGPAGAAEAAPAPVPLDLPVLVLRFRQLNAVAGEGKSVVQRDGNAAKLVAVPSLPLVLYADGLVLDGRPFRPYASPDCAALVEDVLDGYFRELAGAGKGRSSSPSHCQVSVGRLPCSVRAQERLPGRHRLCTRRQDGHDLRRGRRSSHVAAPRAAGDWCRCPCDCGVGAGAAPHLVSGVFWSG